MHAPTFHLLNLCQTGEQKQAEARQGKRDINHPQKESVELNIMNENIYIKFSTTASDAHRIGMFCDLPERHYRHLQAEIPLNMDTAQDVPIYNGHNWRCAKNQDE